jgi:polysaccharide biosynthesis/export protein
MIARVLTASAFVFGLASVAIAQEAVPPTAEAAVTNASASASNPAAAAAAAPAARVIEPVVVDPRDYRIGAEDVLEISVWKNEDLSRDRVPVRPDGKISHPLVGELAVAGLTAGQLDAELTQRFSKYLENPEVSVSVREVHSFKVSVSGNVRMAGQFEVRTADQTVLDMISKAQGFNEYANKGSITVLRQENGKTTKIKFNYGDAVDGKDGADFLVQPGDKIIVN